MSPILLDTNAYATFKRGHPDARLVLRRAPSIAVNPVVIGELLGGFAAGTKEQQNRGELAAFVSSPRVVVLPVDEATAERYATIYAALRRAGTPIPSNDMWIAATAVQHGLGLFTYVGHFGHVAGLRSGSSLSDFANP